MVDKPTIKQCRLVNVILKKDSTLTCPDFTKQAYWKFIGDHECLWRTPKKWMPDEDDLDMSTFNDIWCEEY